MVTKPGVPLAARVKLSAVAFEEDEHEEGEEEVEVFVGGEVADLLDLEAAFEKSGEFGEADRGLAVGAGMPTGGLLRGGIDLAVKAIVVRAPTKDLIA